MNHQPSSRYLWLRRCRNSGCVEFSVVRWFGLYQLLTTRQIPQAEKAQKQLVKGESVICLVWLHQSPTSQQILQVEKVQKQWVSTDVSSVLVLVTSGTKLIPQAEKVQKQCVSNSQ